MSSNRFTLVLPLVLALALGACDDDDGEDITAPDNVTQEDLAGTWTVSSFRCTAADNPDLVFDPFTSGVGLITVTVAPNGQYQAVYTATDPLVGDRTLSGQLVIEDDGSLTHTTPEGTESQGTITSDDATVNTITIVEPNTTADFDNDASTPATAASCTQIWTRTTTPEEPEE